MSSGHLWLGYARGGGRATLDVSRPGNKVLLLGARARDLETLVTLAANQVGASPVVFDLDGSLTGCLSGHIQTYDYRSFLYDSFRLAEPEAWHSQLAAAAYAAALDLSSEEEAIISSAMQAVAFEGTLLSPVSLHDVMGKVEGFRGFYVDKLKGKVGSLRLLDAVEDQGFDRLKSGNVIIDFHGAPYPQAAELAAGLFIAKILAMAHAEGRKKGFLLINEAHRLFKASPHPLHSNRLLCHLLGLPGAVVMSTAHPSSLAPMLTLACQVTVYSGDAWHSLPHRTSTVLSGAFVIHDTRSGLDLVFVPRRVPAKAAGSFPSRPTYFPSSGLTRLILEEVDHFPLSTPDSILEFLAPDFLPADIRSALSSLERQGTLVLEPKDSGSGPRIFCYALTATGRRALEELKG